MRGLLKVMGALACFVLLSTTAFAQAGATLAGVVKDTSGAVLPGVTVQAASAALIERFRETVTDGTGQYRIVDLRPGFYTVTITLTGFNKFERTGIEVTGTGVITINAELRVGSIEETVTVSGETPIVDLQSTSRERVMSAEVVNTLPTGRWYLNIGVLIPGVTSATRDVGGTTDTMGGSLAAHGGSAGDQRITQNGLNVMTLQTGTGGVGGSLPNTSAAQEVAIDTTAANAERQTGGVNINFVPRDGGNTLRGSIFATSAYEWQQASNFTRNLKDQGLVVADRMKATWDVNPGIGGPILRDRLWYYYTYRNNGVYNWAAGMYFNTNEFLPNIWTYDPNLARPALEAHGNWWDSQLRVTWQMNPKHKFAGTWDEQYHCRCPGSVSGTLSPDAAFDRRFPTQRLSHAEWWSPLTSRLLLEFVALHRTERWGNMDLRPTDQGGSLVITPQQYALYPTMIGVTQTNGTADVPNGLRFHGPNNLFNNNWVPNYIYRFAASYITGAHSVKVGFQDAFGFVTSTSYLNTLDPLNRPVRYRFASQNTPDQVTAFHTPRTTKADQNHDLGVYIQDRWTLNRLTLNGGARFDWYTSEIPGQMSLPTTLGRPATHFEGIRNTVDRKDWAPRMGAAYDLMGDGKTAVKISLNKYVQGAGLGGLPSGANPIGRLVHSSSRNWNDNFFPVGDPRRGNKVVDCNLMNAAKNGECTNAGNADFTSGSVAIPGATPDNPSGLTDWNVRRGWGVRSFNWEFSAGVQREVMPRVSVDVSYFRRWYGNFTATDDLAVVPSDFRFFNVTAPLDTRLPGGGGYTVAGFTDFTSVTAATATAINRVVFTDDFNQTEHWNGVDVAVNARLQNGLLLQGSTTTGRRSTNTCGVAEAIPETLGNNPLEHCNQVEPFRTHLKAVGAYTLPRYAALPTTLGMIVENMQIAGTFQSIPGDQMSATYSMPNSTELRNAALSTLAGVVVPGCPATAVSGTNPNGGGLCNGNTKTVGLIKPNTVFEERQNQIDLRIGRILRFGRTRSTVNLDIFNVTNANTVLGRNNSLSKTAGAGVNNQVLQADGLAHTLWVPTSKLQARFFKLSATFDF